MESIRAAGGEVYAITSEPQALADRAQSEWGLNFQCIGDPHQEIADTARAHAWLDLAVAEVTEFLKRDTVWGVSHLKGFYQPGVLALSSEQRVLYRWRSTPTRDNLGGATARPTADYVWESLQSALANSSSANADLDATPTLDVKPPPFPIFAAILMANGWFIRPRPFAYQGDGKNPLRRFPMVIARLIVFVTLWVAAFALLPTVWVSVALALYLPVAVRGIRYVYTSFVNDAE